MRPARNPQLPLPNDGGKRSKRMVRITALLAEQGPFADYHWGYERAGVLALKRLGRPVIGNDGNYTVYGPGFTGYRLQNEQILARTIRAAAV